MKENEIKDTEIRFLGADPDPEGAVESPSEPVQPDKPKRWIWKALGWSLALLFVALFCWQFFGRCHGAEMNTANNDTCVAKVVKEQNVDYVLQRSMTSQSIAHESEACVVVKEDSVNDVAFTLLIPEGCTPHLYIGEVDTTDTSILLLARAADIRQDNHGIVSAFVLRGEPISRGIAKKGFCAIINDTLSLGMDQETPLYERVVAHCGDFFRQYSFVHNGKMVENNPKNKAVRKALCIYEGKVCFVVSKGRESMHDFAQALEDYGVQEAVALVGGDCTFFIRVKGKGLRWFGKYYPGVKDGNFIVFKK